MKRRLSAHELALFESKKAEVLALTTSAEWLPPEALSKLLAKSGEEIEPIDLMLFERLFCKFAPANLLLPHFSIYESEIGVEHASTTIPTPENDPETAEATEEQNRNRLLGLLSKVHYLRLTSRAKEDLRNRVSFGISMILALFLGFVLWYLTWILSSAMTSVEDPSATRGSVVAIVLMSGAGGALVSVLGRLHTLSDSTLSDVRLLGISRVASSFFFSLVTGSAFAIVLYLFFIGELLQGVLFPKVICFTSGQLHEGEWPGIDQFLSFTGPATTTDGGKLFVWSFIAGFFEKFVPNHLVFFSNRANQSRLSEDEKKEI